MGTISGTPLLVVGIALVVLGMACGGRRKSRR